jgi:hypothetical protein
MVTASRHVAARVRLSRGTVVAAVALATLVAGCTSPEATRQRAGGPGADPGNRKAVVQMHQGSNPYYQTPERIGRYGPDRSSLETARQADRLSRGASASSSSKAAPPNAAASPK